MFKEVVDTIKKNKEIKESGRLLGIPWLDLPKLNSVIPGIQKKRMVIVTASSKVGKSMIANFLFMYQPLKYKLQNPHIKLKIFYFSLEISKEELCLQVISKRLNEIYNVTISPENLYSYFKDYTINEEVLKKIEAEKEYFELFERTVEVIGHIKNPTGIYKHVREYAKANGTFYFKGSKVDPTNTIYDTYKPNDPDEYVIVITDHLSLLGTENGGTLRDAMQDYSSNYGLKMRDNFGYTVVNIQQQVGSQEQQQFTFKGDSIVEKLRPSQDGLADCKTTVRDCNLLIGLFSPVRYNLAEYAGYNIDVMRDNYRELSIILNRNGRGSTNLDLGFVGDCCNFFELPSAKEVNYDKFKEWKKSLINK
jgi:hypothetical protein